MISVQPDEKLIKRMAEGDGAAFRDLYQQTSRAVYGLALSILMNRHDAEDVMHDTYIKAYNGAASYRPMGKPLAWLLTITKNLCLSRLRSDRFTADMTDPEEIFGAERSGEDEGDLLDRLMLDRAMQTLTAEERQIVVLHAVTGMKHREIADILEAPVGTVLSRYNRALKKLRTELSGKEAVI